MQALTRYLNSSSSTNVITVTIATNTSALRMAPSNFSSADAPGYMGEQGPCVCMEGWMSA